MPYEKDPTKHLSARLSRAILPRHAMTMRLCSTANASSLARREITAFHHPAGTARDKWHQSAAGGREGWRSGIGRSESLLSLIQGRRRKGRGINAKTVLLVLVLVLQLLNALTPRIGSAATATGYFCWEPQVRIKSS